MGNTDEAHFLPEKNIQVWTQTCPQGCNISSSLSSFGLGRLFPLSRSRVLGSPLFLPEHPIMGPWSTFMEQRVEPLRDDTKHPFALQAWHRLQSTFTQFPGDPDSRCLLAEKKRKCTGSLGYPWVKQQQSQVWIPGCGTPPQSVATVPPPPLNSFNSPTSLIEVPEVTWWLSGLSALPHAGLVDPQLTASADGATRRPSPRCASPSANNPFGNTQDCR